MVTTTSDNSAYLVVEGNDSSSPLLTHSSILSLLLVHPDTLGVSLHFSGTQNNTCLKSLPPSLPPPFSQCFQLSQAKSKLYSRKWKGGKEKSQEFNKAHLNTVKWVMNLHTGIHSVQIIAVF